MSIVKAATVVCVSALTVVSGQTGTTLIGLTTVTMSRGRSAR
jgi:hypothetical protein